MSRALLLPLAMVLVTLGCPSNKVEPQKSASQETPREGEMHGVEVDGEPATEQDVSLDLDQDGKPKAPGSGRTDETNGVCRLYAPQLPAPECCSGEYGFDAEATRKTCGLEVYLGESFHFTCGYYYFKQGAKPPWFRASFVMEKTMKEAVGAHEAEMQRVTKDPKFKAVPVPGVAGAFMSRYKEYRWAFVPGWSKIRKLSWREDSCDDAGIAKVMADLVKAVEPKPDEKRVGLVPTARVAL